MESQVEHTALPGILLVPTFFYICLVSTSFLFFGRLVAWRKLITSGLAMEPRVERTDLIFTCGEFPPHF